MIRFIELTLNNNQQSKVYVNIQNITDITTYDDKVTICTNASSESYFTVIESYEEIKNLINNP